jgi:hypothetical protein
VLVVRLPLRGAQWEAQRNEARERRKGRHREDDSQRRAGGRTNACTRRRAPAASQAPNARRSPAVSPNSQPQTKAAVSRPDSAPQVSKQEALDAYGKLPLSFIPNEGQTDEAVRYYAQGAGYGFFFTHKGAMLSFAEGKGRGQALALDFLGANPHAALEARDQLAGKVNYLVGDDPSEWRRGLPTHAELLYGGLWPGIDMAVRGEGGNLKYEFRLKPGASVEDVRLGYRGAEGLSVGPGRDLLVRTSLGVLKDDAPVSYQRIGGERVPVASRYRLTGDGGYGFAVGAYDPRYPLVIDPGLDYSAFLGGRIAMRARASRWTEVAGPTSRGSPNPPTIPPPPAPSTPPATATKTRS